MTEGMGLISRKNIEARCQQDEDLKEEDRRGWLKGG